MRDAIRTFVLCVGALSAAAALALFGVAGARAQDTSALYDQPVLVIDPGMHTAVIKSTDTDLAGQFAVNGSEDKTVRIWQLGPKPDLAGTIRIPSGAGNIGKIYAVALSPDGTLIAAGGWTRWTDSDRQEQIYLFSRDGKLVKRIDGLPNVVERLTFSADGRYLAAGLGVQGIRVYGRDSNWLESARDVDYGDAVYGLDFAVDGRLATTSLDGHVRLYDTSYKLILKQRTSLGRQPMGVAFRPDGRQLAVGFYDTIAVALLDGQSLRELDPPDVQGIGSKGNIAEIAWSRDGSTLYGAGRLNVGDGGRTPVVPVVAWTRGGSDQHRLLLSGSHNTITSLKALPDGDLLVAAQDPHFAILNTEGSPRWVRPSPNFDARGQWQNFAVSPDGRVVEFGHEAWGKTRVRFDLAKLTLTAGPFTDGLTVPPRQTGLDIQGWANAMAPTLSGKALPLNQLEMSRSLVIDPKGDRFVLGSEWSLRAFDAQGKPLWRRDVPGTVWAVNITGDGRMVVAAYGDGTIRWHRMDDGRELLAFYPLADKTNWVAWTPEGFYGATPGAYSVLKWHVNRGWDQAADAYPVSEFKNLRRPEALALVLQEMETARALGLDDMKRAAREVQQRTNSKLAPGARLHVVSVGVSEYDQNAAHLRLTFAHKDAIDVISALINTQSGLYAQVLDQQITNKEATREHVLDALQAMRRNMAARSGGSDLAVFHFSGHGALINGSYYLLPHDVDARTPDKISNTAIPIDQLKREFAEIGQHGRLLVLLDACHSGASSSDGSVLSVDGGQLRAALAGLANVTVLTSSSSAKPSYESKEWENGAFTKVFLRALGPDADTDRNGLISMTELTTYMSEQLPMLTREKGEQHPGMEVRFQSEMFVSGL